MFTVTVGALVLYGIRYTSPELAVDVDPGFGFARLWPTEGSVAWPAGTIILSANYMKLANARSLRTAHPLVEVHPLASAVDLPQSGLRRDQVQLPLMCGQHYALYPAEIVREAHRSRFYTFTVTCECPMSYLIQTHETGVRCIRADDAEAIDQRYRELPGDELTLGSNFTVKTTVR